MRYFVCVAILNLIAFSAYGQNTVGTITYDPEESLGGYHLIYPERQSTIFLMDECGQVLHRWEDENPNSARPGAVAYLLEDGRILRAKVDGEIISQSSFGAGGSGGVVELLSWDNEVLWTYVVADSIKRQHHDVHYMPSGNVLILAYERFFVEDIVANGFDTLTNNQRILWSDMILEVDPATDSIVWEWHAWDHLVQEHDSSRLNFGEVSEHPERININYQDFTATRDDWIHANALDYNEELDQIMISARNFNEIWIIDHSTTSEQAASSSGGNSDQGGDLLWRWGNPHAYQQATLEEEQLFWNHDAQWIDDFVDEDYPYYGDVAVFNNFIDFIVEGGESRGQIISPNWDAESQTYQMASERFLPVDFSETFSHPDTAKNFSTQASSIQIMGDGHVIMCAGRQGRSFEINPEGELVWEYVTPLRFGQPFPQGSTLNISENFTFQVERYPADYAAFDGRDLSPQGYLELDPNEEFCLLVSADEPVIEVSSLQVFPNPTTNYFSVQAEGEWNRPMLLQLLNAHGQEVRKWTWQENGQSFDIASLPKGLYILRSIEGNFSQQIIKQ